MKNVITIVLILFSTQVISQKEYTFEIEKLSTPEKLIYQTTPANIFLSLKNVFSNLVLY